MGRTGPFPEILRCDVRARYGRNLNTQTRSNVGLSLNPEIEPGSNGFGVLTAISGESVYTII
jgi:hypothetical protein